MTHAEHPDCICQDGLETERDVIECCVTTPRPSWLPAYRVTWSPVCGRACSRTVSATRAFHAVKPACGQAPIKDGHYAGQDTWVFIVRNSCDGHTTCEVKVERIFP